MQQRVEQQLQQQQGCPDSRQQQQGLLEQLYGGMDGVLLLPLLLRWALQQPPLFAPKVVWVAAMALNIRPLIMQWQAAEDAHKAGIAGAGAVAAAAERKSWVSPELLAELLPLLSQLGPRVVQQLLDSSSISSSSGAVGCAGDESYYKLHCFAQWICALLAVTNACPIPEQGVDCVPTPGVAAAEGTAATGFSTTARSAAAEAATAAAMQLLQI